MGEEKMLDLKSRINLKRRTGKEQTTYQPHMCEKHLE